MANLPSSVSLECPICFEFPEAEVYQCKDGHALCGKCYSKVDTCPQCRVPLGSEKIRNRLFESILDAALFPCKYKDVRCNKMVNRKEKPDHEQFCLKGFRLSPVCDMLGWKCNFLTNLLKPSEALDHFHHEHGFPVESKPYANIMLENFDQVDGLKNITWTPFILKLGETPNSSKFIFQIQVSKKDQSLRMGCQLLADPIVDISTNYNVSFSIIPFSSKVVVIDWSIYPKVFSFSGRTTLSLYCTLFKLPINSLKLHYMFKTSLNLNVKVTTESESVERMNNVFTGCPPLCLLPTEKFKGFCKTNMKDYWGVVPCSCDECKANINEELWYWCLQCANWTMCRECMTSRRHSHHVFAMLKGVHQQEYFKMLALNNKGGWNATLESNQISNQASPEEIESFAVECIFCRCFPIFGVLYRCLLCPGTNIDICQSCVEKDEHRCHILGVICNLKQEEFFSSQRKNGSTLMPLLASKISLA